MTHYSYRPHGVCSVLIDFDLDEENKIHNLSFKSGCSGNLQAIGRLSEGKDAEEIADTLSGIRCGFKPTSCGDQLSLAIREALSEKQPA